MSAGAGKTRDEIAEAYDSEPWWYDARGFLILTFAYNSTLTHQLRFFGRNFGRRHLELACGSGTLLQMMLRWRRWKRLPEVDVLGVDYAEPMLAGARRRFADDPHVQLLHADAANLPCDDDSFDTVNIANSVHCFPDVAGALRTAARVLKPGGALAMNVLLHPRGPWPFDSIARRINDWGMRKGILYRPYDTEEIRAFVRDAGLDIAYERVSGNCYDIRGSKPTR